MTDLRFEDHGTIWLIYGQSKAGKKWMKTFLPRDAMTWAQATVVEHRFVENIARGAAADGLALEVG